MNGARIEQGLVRMLSAPLQRTVARMTIPGGACVGAALVRPGSVYRASPAPTLISLSLSK